MPSLDLPVTVDAARLDEIFAHLDRSQAPGVAVGIAVGGEPVYRKAFGLAHLELPVVLTPAMRMRIGSTTKQFTALAYLLLCEDGLARLDDPVRTHLPDVGAIVGDVTARQLLTHTSGLRDAMDVALMFGGPGRRITTEELVELYRTIGDVNAAPTARWGYNNGAYGVMTLLIEKLAGQPLEAVFRDRILGPIGMRDTLLRRFDTDFVPNSATLHMVNAAGGFEKSYLGSAMAGEGGMVSTVEDQLRWLAHLRAPRVGTAATWTVMKTPQVLANGVSTGYGLGLFLGSRRGIEVVYHGGTVMGGNSQTLTVPAAGLDLVIMSNRADVSAGELGERVLDLCLFGGSAAPTQSSTAAPLASGVFYSAASGRVVHLCELGGRQIASIDGLDCPVEPDAAGVLRPGGSSDFLKWSVEMAGDRAAPSSIRFGDFGTVEELRRMPGSDSEDTAAIGGVFRCDSVGVDASIAPIDGRSARLRTTTGFGSTSYRLEPLAPGIWRARAEVTSPWGGVLCFDDDRSCFRLSSFANKALGFRARGR